MGKHVSLVYTLSRPLSTSSFHVDPAEAKCILKHRPSPPLKVSVLLSQDSPNFLQTR